MRLKHCKMKGKYLEAMTWKQAEEELKFVDVIVIPMGKIVVSSYFF